MARQRRQLKEAQTYITGLTGGRHLYSPLELFLADSDAVGIKGESIRIVKGATHNFQRRRLPVAELDQPDDIDDIPTVTAPRQIEFHEDKNEADMARIHAIVTNTTTPKETKELGDSEQLSKLNNLITNNRRNDYEY